MQGGLLAVGVIVSGFACLIFVLLLYLCVLKRRLGKVASVGFTDVASTIEVQVKTSGGPDDLQKQDRAHRPGLSASRYAVDAAPQKSAITRLYLYLRRVLWDRIEVIDLASHGGESWKCRDSVYVLPSPLCGDETELHDLGIAWHAVWFPGSTDSSKDSAREAHRRQEFLPDFSGWLDGDIGSPRTRQKSPAGWMSPGSNRGSPKAVVPIEEPPDPRKSGEPCSLESLLKALPHHHEPCSMEKLLDALEVDEEPRPEHKTRSSQNSDRCGRPRGPSLVGALEGADDDTESWTLAAGAGQRMDGALKDPQSDVAKFPKPANYEATAGGSSGSGQTPNTLSLKPYPALALIPDLRPARHQTHDFGDRITDKVPQNTVIGNGSGDGVSSDDEIMTNGGSVDLEEEHLRCSRKIVDRALGSFKNAVGSSEAAKPNEDSAPEERVRRGSLTSLRGDLSLQDLGSVMIDLVDDEKAESPSLKACDEEGRGVDWQHTEDTNDAGDMSAFNVFEICERKRIADLGIQADEESILEMVKRRWAATADSSGRAFAPGEIQKAAPVESLAPLKLSDMQKADPVEVQKAPPAQAQNTFPLGDSCLELEWVNGDWLPAGSASHWPLDDSCLALEPAMCEPTPAMLPLDDSCLVTLDWDELQGDLERGYDDSMHRPPTP